MTKALTTRLNELANTAAPKLQSSKPQAKFNHGKIQIGEREATSMDVIIVASMLEHTYYTTQYDPERISAPACYSYSVGQNAMVPHPEAADPQCDTCAGCPQNQWGSMGKGKACKERVRIGFISTDVDPASAVVYYARAAVTSTANWAKYQSDLAARGLMLPLQCVTTIEAGKHPRWGNVTEVRYSFKEAIADEKKVDSLIELAYAADSALHEPYAEAE